MFLELDVVMAIGLLNVVKPTELYTLKGVHLMHVIKIKNKNHALFYK